MKASLKIEAIGDDTEQFISHIRKLSRSLARDFIGEIPRRSWCAEVTGRDPRYGYQRVFLRCKKDYRESNSKGSRGVYKLYILESGEHVYEVSNPVSWRNTDRYFCRVTDDGDIVRIEQKEVDVWINRGVSPSESTS